MKLGVLIINFWPHGWVPIAWKTHTHTQIFTDEENHTNLSISTMLLYFYRLLKRSVTQNRNAHGEYPHSSTMQLWKRLTADVLNHVHGLVRQKAKPGLCQRQQVFCLLLWLQWNINETLVNWFTFRIRNISYIHTHTCRVRSWEMASKLRTLSSVAPELASWLILNNTALNFSPEDEEENRSQRSTR